MPQQTDQNYSRQWPDPEEQFFPNPLLLDRHRILHSTSFRRLGYKTQVYLPLEADHFRTRLTHTLEVGHLAIILAYRLGGDPLLTEVVSLAHDLGHGPFGHSSEKILDQLMKDIGGFEHNQQSLRVVQYLESPYPWFRGLNLTQATIEGLQAHTTPYDRPDETHVGHHLEGQLVNWADRLAYNIADLEDSLGAGLLTHELLKDLHLYRQAWDQMDPSLQQRPLPAVRRVVLEYIQKQLIESLEVQRLEDQTHVAMNDTMLQHLKQLENLLMEKVYFSDPLKQTARTVQEIIVRLFNRYRQRRELLPARYLSRQTDQSLDCIIGDYIAGMTDRFCLKTYRQLFGPDDELLNSIQPIVGIVSQITNSTEDIQ